MICCNLFQRYLTFSLLIVLITGRALYVDQSEEEDNSDLLVNEQETNERDNSNLPEAIYEDENAAEVDSYEERKFYERSIFSTLRPPHYISARTREALIDILQKAVGQGWRPNLKHYNPSTRFGRHRR